MIDLFQLGTLLRCPGGQVETVPAQKMAGIKWAALNMGTDPCVQRNPAVWDHQRDLYKAEGVAIGPWMHCRSMADIEFLISVGESWPETQFIGCNIEDVVNDKLSLQEVGGVLLDFWVNKHEKPVHMPTLPWVQNDQHWEYVSFAYLALEMFPLEGQGQMYLDAYQRCIDHAFAEGAEKVTLLYSTTSPRSVYPNVAHCLYTADNVTNWSEWKDSVRQVIPKPPDVPIPPKPPEAPMLSVTQFPFTGPLFGPSTSPGPTLNRSTVKGLKRAQIRLGYLNAPLGSETDDFGIELEDAFKAWWKKEGGLGKWTAYGLGSWNLLRASKLTQGPNKGQYAMDSKALAYVREDALTQCYPHPLAAPHTFVGQGPHQTDGLPKINIAIDFMAPGGTKVLAVENAQITKLSGHDPKYGVIDPPGVFGWTVYYSTPAGYEYFSTHYGKVLCTVGMHVDCGQVIAEVGNWPGDPARSHTHLGVSSPKGRADATKRILAISQAKRIAA